MERDGFFAEGIVAMLNSSKVRFVFASQVMVKKNYLNTDAPAIP